MTTSPETHGELRELIAAYVMGDLDTQDLARFEGHLTTCERCVAEVEGAAVIHRIGATGTASPRDALRATVLAAAFDSRPSSTANSGAVVVGSCVSAWEAEAGRFRALLDDPLLGRREVGDDGAWGAICSETFDLSVRSMVCHLIAAESLRASVLGAPIEQIPETTHRIEERTQAVIDRHAGLPVGATIDEYDGVVVAMTYLLGNMDATRRAEASAMVPGFTIDEHTALRALEVWTHADDIRGVLAQAEARPHEEHIRTMTSVLPQWISFALRHQDVSVRDRDYRISLSGPGGQLLDVAPPQPQSPRHEAVSFSCDAVEFCKLAGARRDPAQFVYDSSNDPAATQTFVHALASFELI